MRKTFKYSLSIFCAYVVFFWSGVKPPIVNFNDIKELQGIYMCYVSGGRSPSGQEMVDHIRYSSRFSYIFGVEGPGSCFKQINGHLVSIKYIQMNDSRVLMELKSINDGRIYGNSLERNVKIAVQDVQDKSPIYWVKSIFLTIFIYFLTWKSIKNSF